MQPFSPPPLKIIVHKLDGVEDRPFNHLLTPEDVRKDAFYQKLARRNAFLEWEHRHIRSLVVLAGLIAFAFNVLYLTPWVQSRQQGMLEEAFTWYYQKVGVYTAEKVGSPIATANAATTTKQPVSTPAAAPVVAALASAPASAFEKTTPEEATQPSGAVSSPMPSPSTVPPIAQAQPSAQPVQADAANQLAAAIKALIAQQSAKQSDSAPQSSAPTAAGRPITVVPAITSPRPAGSIQQGSGTQKEPLPVHESAPIKAGPISIMDFFGANTAVSISSDGGQTLRTYRVGDSLPSGEVIKAIDTANGSITTNLRIVKK